jgi:hypothetical protein
MFKNKNINTILIISIFLFSIKWILSFYFYNESLSVKIIFDSGRDGETYFPLIKYLASFELNKSFDPYIENLKIVPLPFTGIFFHSIFLKIFGYSAIIILEFLAFFTFLIIFYKIFSYFFSSKESILLSLFLFTIPSIISILSIENLPYINLLEKNFYYTRIPRPMISSLYLFSFLYLLVSMEKGEIFTKKKFILLGIILGFTVSSFYYFFIIEVITFFFFLIYKFKFNFLKKILEQYESILLSIFFFLVSILPFFFNLLFHDKDTSARWGVFQIDFEKKKILFEHYLNGYLKIEFLLVFIVSIFFVYLANKKRILNHEIINIFFILFLGSVFAPMIFVLLSNKVSILYHFNNTIVVWSFLFFVIYFITILKYLFKIELNIYICRLFFILITFLYCFDTYQEQENKYNNQIVKEKRIEFQKITGLINDNLIITNASLMTFDRDLMIWAILNDIKYLSLVNALFVSKTDDMIENDIIRGFKFLNLNVLDFKYFLRNQKQKWRYINYNVATFFFYKYQANSLKTFNDSKNFDPEIAKFIFATSPLYQHQQVIPNEEFIRLEKKFKDTEMNEFNIPDVIVLEKSMSLIKNIVIQKDYCKSYDGNIYILYFRKKSEIKCSL